MGKPKLTREIKRQFANAFMKTGAGFEALKMCELPEDYGILYKLLNDDYVNEYVTNNMELVEIATGKTREAHVAALEKLFRIATGTEEAEEIKIVNGTKTTVKTKSLSISEATRVSERIEKLKGWDKQSPENQIDIDLQLGIEAQETSIEPEEQRDNKVADHFKKAGLI